MRQQKVHQYSRPRRGDDVMTKGRRDEGGGGGEDGGIMSRKRFANTMVGCKTIHLPIVLTLVPTLFDIYLVK
jgi:hypothetical protein